MKRIGVQLVLWSLVLLLICAVVYDLWNQSDQVNFVSDSIESDPVPKVHFILDYAEDIKLDPRFDTEVERERYKEIGFSWMEEIYQDFYRRFHFQPKHRIHIIIASLVQGTDSVAYTTSEYDGEGTIQALSMHFPLKMFEREFVRAHELTHAFIAPFHLPTWADEGFAVLQENLYVSQSTHSILDLDTDIRRDSAGQNLVQDWQEWQGIYADGELTDWCYRYSHSVVAHIEREYPGTFARVFAGGQQPRSLTTQEFIGLLDRLIEDDMISFFEGIGFKL